MTDFIEPEPIELNDDEITAVAGGFSIGGFNVALGNSTSTSSFNNSGNVSISDSIIVAPEINVTLAVGSISIG
jgi:hypothetical protein